MRGIVILRSSAPRRAEVSKDLSPSVSEVGQKLYVDYSQSAL
jgi:hypothetical protein